MTDEIVFNSDEPSINERFVEIYKNLTGDKESRFDEDTLQKTIKYEIYELPNEFSSGYFIKHSELCILLFILIFWLMAIRKFIRNFNKIRTTHYREMPYKYKVKDSINPSLNDTRENLSFQPNPVNRIIKDSKLAYQYDLISNPNTTPNSLYSIKQTYAVMNHDKSIENITVISRTNYNKKRLQFSIRKNPDMFSKYNNSVDSRITTVNELDSDENLSHSLGNLNLRKACLRRDDSVLNDNIYRSNTHKVKMPHFNNSQRSLRVKSGVRYDTIQRQRTVEHPLMSPLVRRSFLDLHKVVETRGGSNQLIDSAV